MAFRSTSYFITSAYFPDYAIVAEDSSKGSRLSLQPFQNNFAALFNIDFDQGLFALATSGNQLVIAANEVADGSPLQLDLLPEPALPSQRWDVFSQPGNIVSQADRTLAFGFGMEKIFPPALRLRKLHPGRPPMWILRPLTAPGA